MRTLVYLALFLGWVSPSLGLEVVAVTPSHINVCAAQADGSPPLLWKFVQLDTGNWTYGGVFLADENCNVILHSDITTADMGYALSLRLTATGARPIVGNHHRYETDFTLLNMTKPGTVEEFVIEQEGFIVHPSSGGVPAGNTGDRHGKVHRLIKVASDGTVTESLQVEWLTDVINDRFYIGQVAMADTHNLQKWFPLTGRIPKDITLEDPNNNGQKVVMGKPNSVLWSTTSDYVVYIKTDAVGTRFKYNSGKVYPLLAPLGTRHRSAGDIDSASWTWKIEKSPGFVPKTQKPGGRQLSPTIR